MSVMAGCGDSARSQYPEIIYIPSYFMSRACSSATNPPQLWWEAEPALSPHLMLTVTQKFFPLTPAGKIALKRVHFFFQRFGSEEWPCDEMSTLRLRDLSPSLAMWENSHEVMKQFTSRFGPECSVLGNRQGLAEG